MHIVATFIFNLGIKLPYFRLVSFLVLWGLAGEPAKMAALMASPRGGNPFAGLTRKHGIKCESVDGIGIEAYVQAISNIIGSKNILAASRVNRSVIVFVDCVTSVELVCADGLTVGDSFLYVEPLVKPSTKVILSGVPPYVPNSLLERELSNYGRVVSVIRFIPLGCKNPELRHVKSFRRQVYMICEENSLDGVINITHDQRTVRIYLSTDEITCHKCHKKGHIQRNCLEALNTVPINHDKLTDKDFAPFATGSQNVWVNNTPETTTTDTSTDIAENDTATGITDSDTMTGSNDNNTNNENSTENDITDKTLIDDNVDKNNIETEKPGTCADDSTFVQTSTGAGQLDATRTGLCDVNEIASTEMETTADCALNNDEERVRTPPSTTTPSEVLSSSVDASHIDPFDKNPFQPPSLPFDDMDDLESVASDVSDISCLLEDIDMTEASVPLISHEKIQTFLDDTYNSKHLIDQAKQFSPDLNLLIRSLSHFRKNNDFPPKEKIRIRRLTCRIASSIGINRVPRVVSKASDRVLDAKRGISTSGSNKPKLRKH